MNDEVNSIRNCLNCIFQRPVDMPGPDGKILIGKKINTCQRFPPTMVAIPVQGGVNIGAMFPQVTKEISCAEHRMEGETHPLVNGLPERLLM